MTQSQPIIRIAYAEDYPVIRIAVANLINDIEGMRVDMHASNGRLLIQQIQKAENIPHLCILGIEMKEMNGFETVIAIKKVWPDMKILILSAFPSEFFVIRMITYGVNGFIDKACQPDELKNALITIFNLGMYYNSIITPHLYNEVKSKKRTLPELTDKEMEVLSFSCSILTYSKIAKKMNTTSKSIEGYRDRLYKKLNITSRIGLALFAVQYGLVLVDAYPFKEQENIFQKHL